ncbi:unnamed protein product [Rhodiola kirilowii]
MQLGFASRWIGPKNAVVRAGELRLEAYEGQSDYKARTKLYHDKFILQRDFEVGQRVLLFSSRLRLMPGKLRSKWTGPLHHSARI